MCFKQIARIYISSTLPPDSDGVNKECGISMEEYSDHNQTKNRDVKLNTTFVKSL